MQCVDLSGLSIYGDENRLEKVLLNYISNAIKYAPQSNEVTLEALLLPDESIQIRVTYNGIGIFHEEQQWLFQKYYQVEESACKFQGLGLGLFICAEIIKLHKGEVGVKSDIGKGSTFYFRVPLNPVVAERPVSANK